MNNMRGPDSWFLVGESSSLKPGRIQTFSLGQKKIVIYRSDKGELVATSSKCPHMGADLSKGHVKNCRLVCPFHAWEYDKDGKCVHIPADPENKSCKSKLQTFKVMEKYGLIFLFTASEEGFALPFFNDLKDKPLYRSKPFNVIQEASYLAVAANGFDVNHFVHVHKRQPIADPIIDNPTDSSMRIQLNYKIIPGSSLGDRILSYFFNRKGQLDYWLHGGNFVLATAKFGKMINHMMIVLSPLEKNRSMSTIVIFSNVENLNIIQKIYLKFKLRVMSILSKKFFEVEADEVQGAVLSKKSLHESDHYLKRYLDWLDSISNGVMA